MIATPLPQIYFYFLMCTFESITHFKIFKRNAATSQNVHQVCKHIQCYWARPADSSVQAILCQGVKNEISSQRSAPLQQSQPTTEITPISQINLQSIRAAMKASTEVKERFKKKTTKIQTTNRHWRNRFCQFSVFSKYASR